jgi:hypothetical protein
MSHPPLFPTSGKVYVYILRTSKEAYNPERLLPRVKQEGGSVMVWAAISSYNILLVPLFPFMAKLLKGVRYMERLGDQVHPMIQMLFPNNDAVFQDDNVPVHIAGTVQLWFQKHEGKLQHLPGPAQSPDLNIIQPLWSVLEIRVRNRFPPPAFVKQFEDVLQEEWYNILLEAVQNLYESIPRRIVVLLKANGVLHHFNKEMYTVSVGFPLFCTTSVYHAT